MPRAIVLDVTDNVATLLDPGRAGDACELQGESSGKVTLLQDVPFGHKVCIAATAQSAEVVKYGEIIGRASQALQVGEHTHLHNLESARGRGDVGKR